jgi:transporter family-2 protein
MPKTAPSPPRKADTLALALALGSGGLLTLMVLFNGTMGLATTPIFSSLAAHATGTVAAALILATRHSTHAPNATPAPVWAYLAGLSGALTVVLTSTTVNTPLALGGTIALGLAGQSAFALAADRWGWFGLPRRRPGLADYLGAALVLAGSALIIFGGRGA